jgi:hypothetical protein
VYTAGGNFFDNLLFALRAIAWHQRLLTCGLGGLSLLLLETEKLSCWKVGAGMSNIENRPPEAELYY